MKLTNARGSKLVRLGPDDVVNDFANPIQLVTLTADNAWHDFDFSGYEIMMLPSSPLTYVKVNFSNSDSGIVLVPGKRVRSLSGFAGCRLFLGHENSLSGSPGTTISLAFMRVPIEVETELKQPPSFTMTYHSGSSAPGASTVILDTGALIGGLYEIEYNCHTYVGASDTYRLQHRNAGNTGNVYELVNSLSGSLDNVMMQKTTVFVATDERFRIVTSTGSAIGFTACFRLTRIG